MFSNGPKLVGKHKLVSAKSNIDFRVEVKLPVVDIKDIIGKFKDLDIRIVKVNVFSVSVMLPRGWLVIYSNKKYIFIDNEGRGRVIWTKKKCIIVKHITIISYKESPKDSYPFCNITVLLPDASKLKVDFDNAFKLNAIMKQRMTDTTLNHIYMEEASKRISEVLPEWNDPLKYWDDDIYEILKSQEGFKEY